MKVCFDGSMGKDDSMIGVECGVCTIRPYEHHLNRVVNLSSHRLCYEWRLEVLAPPRMRMELSEQGSNLGV